MLNQTRAHPEIARKSKFQGPGILLSVLLFDESEFGAILRFTFLLQSDERRRVRRLFSAIAHGELSLLR